MNSINPSLIAPPALPSTVTDKIYDSTNSTNLDLSSTQNIGSIPTYNQKSIDTKATANSDQVQYDLRGTNQNSLISRAKYAITERSLQAERVDGFRQILEQLKQK